MTQNAKKPEMFQKEILSGIDVSKMDINVRVDAFNKELIFLQEKYGLKLYASNQVIEGGEVLPMIKVMDPSAIGRKPAAEEPQKMHDNNQNKAQKGRPTN